MKWNHMRKRLISLWQDIQDVADEITPNLPDLPEPEVEEGALGWLYDSGRDYFEQLAPTKIGKACRPKIPAKRRYYIRW